MSLTNIAQCADPCDSWGEGLLQGPQHSARHRRSIQCCSVCVTWQHGTHAGTPRWWVAAPGHGCVARLFVYWSRFSRAASTANHIACLHAEQAAICMNTVAQTSMGYWRHQCHLAFVHAAGSPLTIADHVACGAGAGLAGSFVACPTELIKCRLQARSGAMPQVRNLSPS